MAAMLLIAVWSADMMRDRRLILGSDGSVTRQIRQVTLPNQRYLIE
jgi:hypothetical protein